jgi:hypothetical protein
VEYAFVEDSLVTKARALNEGLGRLDPLVQALLGLYPIVTFQYSATALCQVSDHIRYLFFIR